MQIYTLMRIHSPSTQIAGSYLKFKGKIWDVCHLYSRSLYSKGDNSEVVQKSVCEEIGVIPDVIAIGKDISKGQFEIKCTLELYNSILVNKILFNCRSWSHLKEIELKDPEKVQLQTLKQIMSAILNIECRCISRASNFTMEIYNPKEKTGFLLTSYINTGQ